MHNIMHAPRKYLYFKVRELLKHLTIRKLANDHLHWSSFPAMSVERAKAAHHANGKIFIIAGGEDGDGAALNSAEVYSEGSWSAISNMPSSTSG